MNNKNAAVIIRPYLEKLDLSAESMANAYSHLRISEYVTRFCLRSYLEYAKLSVGNETDEVGVDVGPVIRDVLVLMKDNLCRGLTSLAPNPKPLIALINKATPDVSAELVAVFLMHDAILKGESVDTDVDKFIFATATPEDLFRVAQAKSGEMLKGELANILEGIAQAWEMTHFEETAIFADFADEIGKLSDEAQAKFPGSFMQKFLNVDAKEVFDYSGVEMSQLPFAQFANVYTGTFEGVLDARFGDKAVELLDYHLSLLVRD